MTTEPIRIHHVRSYTQTNTTCGRSRIGLVCATQVGQVTCLKCQERLRKSGALKKPQAEIEPTEDGEENGEPEIEKPIKPGKVKLNADGTPDLSAVPVLRS